jgi:transposase-like protein
MGKKDLGNQNVPQKNGGKRKNRKYSYGLKRKVVYEVEQGILSINQAREKYEIRGKSLIYSWIKKYGLLYYNPEKAYQMKQSPQEKIKELQMRIEELELDKDILLDIQEAFEEEGVDVKKYLPEQLKKDYINHQRKGK